MGGGVLYPGCEFGSENWSILGALPYLGSGKGNAYIPWAMLCVPPMTEQRKYQQGKVDSDGGGGHLGSTVPSTSQL